MLVETAVMTLLAAWLAGSAAYQFRAVSNLIGRYDRFGLLPRWTFFAPNPGIHDHHLMYRECHSDADLSTPEGAASALAALSSWREVADLVPGHSYLFVWNPQRRVTKTMSDIINNLSAARHKNPDFVRYIQFTVEYFWLLHLVLRGASPAVQRQFAVIRTHGFGSDRKAEVVFVSKFHPAS